MSQLSSFLRFGPILSHNLVKVGGKGYSSLCKHCPWDFKIMLECQKKAVFEENNIFFIKHFPKINKLVLLMKKGYIERSPFYVYYYSMRVQGRQVISSRRQLPLNFGNLHCFFIVEYYSECRRCFYRCRVPHIPQLAVLRPVSESSS